jgi:sigma-B regulation protein RsbU (phosphoserine phosphatase)
MNTQDDTIGKRVLHDLREGDVPRKVKRDLKDLEFFYLAEEDRRRLSEMGLISRWFWRTVWLLKRVVLSLSPARRLLLILAVVLFFIGPCSYQEGDVRFGTDFDFLSVAILLLIIMLELKDKLLARSELEAGHKVQSALLPDRPPELLGWDIWLFTRPANDVGGDLVDYVELSRGRLGLALGDVAGKGLAAALFMSKLQSTLRALVTRATSLAQLGSWLNDVFCRDGLPQRFASLVYLELRPDDDRVQLLNAGHLPPLLVRSRSHEVLPHGAPALGIIPRVSFQRQTVLARSGDLLLVYSDGVVEARNEEGAFFGEERLLALLPLLRTKGSEEAGNALVRAVDDFVGEAPRNDDLSVILLKRKGRPVKKR